jgi:hypothetical protein
MNSSASRLDETPLFAMNLLSLILSLLGAVDSSSAIFLTLRCDTPPPSRPSCALYDFLYGLPKKALFVLGRPEGPDGFASLGSSRVFPVVKRPLRAGAEAGPPVLVAKGFFEGFFGSRADLEGPKSFFAPRANFGLSLS